MLYIKMNSKKKERFLGCFLYESEEGWYKENNDV